MESARVWFFWLFAGGTLLSLLVLGTIQLIALLRMRSLRRRRPDSGRPLPPISILKPIKGLDPELRPNLEALLSQDYPEYEVLFAVKDPDDPVVPVLRELIRNHPEAPLRLFVGATGPGMNPKVNSLGYVARYARHEHLLISDADVRPPPDYLWTLASELEEGVGLVHSLLLGTGERRLGSVLESLHMNSFVAASLCGADWVGHSCVVGKSMLFSRRDLAEIGGFAAVENVLAEDYLLGQRFQRAGLGVRLCTRALPVVNPGRTLGSFCSRQLRWAQLRRWLCLQAYLVEVLANPIAWLLAWIPWAVAAPMDMGLRSLFALAAAVVVLKCLGDLVLSRALRGDFRALRHLPWIPIKDLLIASVWLLGMVRRRVNWRGNVMWIGPESRLSAGPHDLGPVAHAARA